MAKLEEEETNKQQTIISLALDLPLALSEDFFRPFFKKSLQLYPPYLTFDTHFSSN